MAIQDSATKQLGALPFGNIIGGPLVAAIEAQALAARSTVEFIESVAFVPLPQESDSNTPREVQNIQFQYESKDPQGNFQKVNLIKLLVRPCWHSCKLKPRQRKQLLILFNR